MKITLQIGWLFPDVLNLYADGGNILVFEKILKANQIDYKINKITRTSCQKLDDIDILLIGGGSDFNQALIYSDFIKKKQEIKNLIDNKGFILAICGGYQLLGKEYITNDNTIIKGLNIFDYTTKATKQRMCGNIYTKVILDNQTIDVIGFENHSGETVNVTKPFGKVIKGYGNTHSCDYEGYMNNNFIGTYIHGPLLPKNPEIALYIIKQVLKNKYQIDCELINPLKYAQLAKEQQIKKIMKE